MAIVLAGCANLEMGLASLPLPAPVAGGPNYAVIAVFSNALNLPAKAKVKFFGADIGEVDSMWAQDFNAHVKLRIRADIRLHVGATAELRSATPLGDIFVAIKPDPRQTPDAALINNGDTIPLNSTGAQATVEQLLASMALLVNGGTVRNLVNMLNGAGQAVGGRGEKLGQLLQQSTTLLSTMTARSQQIDAALRQTSELAATIAARRDTLQQSLTTVAPAMSVIADNTDQIADLIDGVARITAQLSRLPSIQGTDTRSLAADINHLARAFNDVSQDPSVSLTPLLRLIGLAMRATNSTAAHASATVAKLALVPWPDKNYPGDPGFHWTDGTDYHQMIGSLRYEWNLLLDKIYGAQRPSFAYPAPGPLPPTGDGPDITNAPDESLPQAGLGG
ncbi:MCE family protein [Mycobacterium sp. pUA109]|uniref:MCE family protein n=1 Tax=Mycobacterium sp. pUA109 TaxID=3238982 RepID=UPI00351B3600